ncbi:calcium-activated chloride channel regulator 2-like [Pollicipes pollicipes]|uniref:calcium-activated chloride channel regulator 2-like n=1 Tax=Pollicipes pollicipes TaxID=41117 RepID=UPI0018851B2A|nr:calcium-activated chloride channel regulator 2-like [Pollicipes pollicipes]
MFNCEISPFKNDRDAATRVPQGRYSVVCEVRNDGNAVINEGFSASAAMPNPNTDSSSWCCGSTSPIGNTRPTGNFTRTVSAGAFQVTNNARGGLLPPAQVTDLVMSERASDGAVVTWTAPGADLDQGTAYRYQFKWSTNATDLSPTQFDANGEEVNSSLVAPPEISGTMQNLTLPVPSNLDTVYLAMRTFDQQGHRSAVSNTAILYLGSVPSPPNDDGLSAGAIVGIVIAAVVLLAVAVVGALMVRRRRRVMTL